ncbi:MAG TPA: hypothetical protein VMV68_03900 [Spirochaetia bacterium]|nr:hypothetical protein [Spirochaetia bacterium]
MDRQFLPVATRDQVLMNTVDDIARSCEQFHLFAALCLANSEGLDSDAVRALGGAIEAQGRQLRATARFLDNARTLWAED